METNRKLNKLFRFTITTLFLLFLAIFVSHKTGYIEYENRKQVELTAKQIEIFEKDIEEGKALDLKPYLKTSQKNYQNGLSKIGLNISKTTGKIVSVFVDHSFKFLSKLTE